MPAEIETMMYTQDVPWHGLGTYVGEHPILSEEAIVAAGLDWHVEKSPAFAAVTVGEDEREVEAEDWFFNVRTSDNRVLGAVQGRYEVLQNVEAFEFMDHLAGSQRLVRYHTAGSLQGGKHVWMLAELVGLTIEPVPGDETQPYLLLVNGHDGRMPLKVVFTSVRVVCQNTLNLALRTSQTGITIRHTGKFDGKLKEARKVLGLARTEIEEFRDVARELALKQLGDKAWKAVLDELYPLPDGQDNTRRVNTRARLTSLFESGPGSDIPGVRGTAWGALQAVTDYTTHHRTTRGAGDDTKLEREKRLESAWFGSGNAVNQKALEFLRAL